MGFKRMRAYLFERSTEMRWLIVNDAWRNVRSFQELPPGTDLLRTFLTTLLRYHDEGWTLHEFTAFNAEFFAHKGNDKVLVQIASEDPTQRPVRLL
jgi:hypothetical protein